MNNYNHNGGPDLSDDAANPYGVDGYVKIARAMRFHPFVGCGHPVKPADPGRGHSWSRHEAWEDLICECRYRDGHVMNKGRLMEIKPGQLLGAVSWLANRWNWTPHTVRWFLDKLEELGMVERATEQQTSQFGRNQPDENERCQSKPLVRNQINLISVCNYGIYQTTVPTSQQPIKATSPQPNREPVASAPQHLNKGRREEVVIDSPVNLSELEMQLDEAPVEVVSAPKARKSRPTKMESLRPADWSPGHQGLAFAVGKGMTPEQAQFEFERFCARHDSLESKYKDWDASWRTWCLNWVKFSKSAPARNTVRPSMNDMLDQALGK